MNIFKGFDNSKDPGTRDFCSFVVFGDLGKGKSSWLRQFALMYQAEMKSKKLPRKILICDPSNSRAFDDFPKTTLAAIERGVDIVGAKVTKWNEGIRVLRDVKWTEDYWFSILQENYKNGLLILDESRDFFKPSGLTPVQKRLFTIHRNAAIDLMCVSHNFMDLPLNIRKIFRIYIVFRTGDKPTGENWCTNRTLPEALYGMWKTLSRMIAPASKISPYYWHDAVSGLTKLYVHPDDKDTVKVVVSEVPRVEVTYRQFEQKKYIIK
jgi:hypothetical protein